MKRGQHLIGSSQRGTAKRSQDSNETFWIGQEQFFALASAMLALTTSERTSQARLAVVHKETSAARTTCWFARRFIRVSLPTLLSNHVAYSGRSHFKSTSNLADRVPLYQLWNLTYLLGSQLPTGHTQPQRVSGSNIPVPPLAQLANPNSRTVRNCRQHRFHNCTN